MRVQGLSAAVIVAGLALLATVPAVDAGPLKRLREKAERSAERVVAKKVEDEVTQATQCVVGDAKCVEQARQDGREVVLVDADGNVVRDAEGHPPADPRGGDAASTDEPGQGVWRNYDFTPGRDVWRHVVFDDERVGRFPAGQLEFVRGNMQVVELDGKRVLEVAGDSVFRLHLDRPLPAGFTLEFLLRLAAPNVATRVLFSPLESAWAKYDHHYLHLYRRSGIGFRGNAASDMDGFGGMAGQLTPVKLQVDGSYAILYVGQERAANLPNASFPQTDRIEFRLGGNSRLRSYIADITVAVGLDRLYESLMDGGRFTTRGIYFDVDSARIRPESTPTLLDIEQTLTRHSELAVRVEGHTDATGQDAHNLELSQRRAKAVVDYLVRQGVEANRLEAVGRGETEPIADNASPAGRQQNRRVVIALRE